MRAERERAGSGRPRSRRGQGELLRRDILDAVNRLLVEWGGADKLTIRAVAQEVGVAAPSIYLHFSDKAELVWTALTDKYAQLAELMRAADEGAADGDPLARLRAQVHAYCRFGLHNPGHYRLMFETRQPAVDASRIGRHPAKLVSGSLRHAVTRSAEAGCVLSLPAEQLATTLWAGLHGTVSLSHSIFSDDLTEQLVLDLADGLLGSLIALPGDTTAPRPGAEGAVDTLAMRRIRDLLGTADDSPQS
ncbi:TetR/AcrR family transcriptional regulator [Streptomyces sp. NPDC088725]|uniref:TetR/AcrR family transcriptional regulator n=1 Tax=Streptomyces sp. NPDC088725 TaxID=3365873 RepID=UPI00381DC6A6